jgi:hypothetical protein
MTIIQKGSPTYIGECYIDVDSEKMAECICLWLIKESVFFVVEPMSDNVYRFFTKEEFNAGLRTIVNTLRKELDNENHRSFAASR